MRILSALLLFALGVLVGWSLKNHWVHETTATVSGVVSQSHEVNRSSYDQVADESKRKLAVPAPPLDFFLQWLQQKEYRRAIEFLALLPSKNDNQSFEYYRQRLFNSLVNDKSLNQHDVIEIIDHYLSYYHNDYEFLVQKARYQEAVADYLGALQTLYAAKLYVISPNIQKEIRDRIDRFLKDKSKLLVANNPTVLGRMIEVVQDKEPQYVPLALLNAETLIQWKQYDKAYTQLDNLPLDGINDQRVNLLLRKVASLQQAISHSEAEFTEKGIPLQRIGHHYVVDLEILGVGLTRLIIDTGASYTTLSDRILVGLQEPYGRIVKDNVRVNTANGLVIGQLFKSNLVRLGDHELVDIELISIPLENFNDIDGLLGMNILKQFEFRIDQENSVLILN
ncbi:MAG: retroviral-like aspartic protease family protein [Pseudomonadales bacterium]|nr:retroviral-like aspartic protease family protein [Pseudomonadales bacterium]